MIHEEIVTHEVAKLAKVKGFPHNGHHRYYEYGGSRIFTPTYREPWYGDTPIPSTCVAAPTQALLQRWLREDKSLEVYVRDFEKTTDFPHHYWNFITDGNGKTLKVGDKMFATYELALEDGLRYALEKLV